MPANLVICRHYLLGRSSQGDREVVFDAGYAGSAPCGRGGLFALIEGTNRAGEGHLAAIGRHINVLGIDLGVTLQSLLDRILNRSRLGTRCERDVIGNPSDPARAS